MSPASSHEVIAIVVTGIVLFATGLLKAAGESTWDASLVRFQNRRDTDC